MHETFQLEVHRIVRLVAIFRRLGTKQILGPAAQPRHVPWHLGFCDRLGHAQGPALRHRNHASKIFLGENLHQSRAHGGERERVARQRSSDPAHVAVFKAMPGGDAIRNRLRKTVRRTGNASADGFAENQNVRIEIFCPRIAAGARADRVRFIQDEQRAVLARQLSQPLMETGRRMHDANIRHGGLGQHAGNVARRERGFQPRQIVELDDLCRN